MVVGLASMTQLRILQGFMVRLAFEKEKEALELFHADYFDL
jgi:hypothetical protein